MGLLDNAVSGVIDPKKSATDGADFANDGSSFAAQRPSDNMPMVPAGLPQALPKTDPYASVSYTKTIGAAAQENYVVGGFNHLYDSLYGEGSNDPPEDLSAGKIREIVGKQDERFLHGPQGLDPFLDAQNTNGVHRIISEMKASEQNEKTLFDSGWAGTIAGVASGFIDPLFFFAPELKGASMLTKIGGNAAFGAGQAIASNTIRQATNPSAPRVQDTGMEVASNAILMGVLGGAHGMLSKSERATGSNLMDAARSQVAGDVEAAARSNIKADIANLPEPAPLHQAATIGLGDAAIKDVGQAGELAAASIDHPEILSRLHAAAEGDSKLAIEKVAQENGVEIQPLAMNRFEGQPPVEGNFGEGSSTGAAQVDTRTNIPVRLFGVTTTMDALAKVPYVGKATEAMRDLYNNVSPNTRIMMNGAKPTRLIAGDLVENDIRMTQGAKGVTTARDGAAIETLYRQQKNKMLLEASDALEKAWQNHYYGEGVTPSLKQKAGAIMDAARDTVPEGRMPRKEFNEQVSDALNNGDVHPNADVQQAAQGQRKLLLDPIKERMQNATDKDGVSMLGDLQNPPKGSKSFFPQLWDKAQVTANRFELRKRIADWYGGEQANKIELQASLRENLQGKEYFDKELKNSEARMATIERQTEQTKTRLSERGMAENTGLKRVENIDTQMSDLRESLSQIDEFTASMKGQANNSETLKRLAELDKQAASMRRELEPMSARESARLDRVDVAQAFPGHTKLGAEMYLGLRGHGKQMSFIDYAIKKEGISLHEPMALDALGDKSYLKKYVKKGGKTLDDIGESLMQEFPEHFNGERPTPSEVADYIRNSAKGSDPSFFREAMDNTDGYHTNQAQARRFADSLDELLQNSRADPKTLPELALAIADVTGGGSSSKMKAILAKFDTANELSGLTEHIQNARADLENFSKYADKAAKDKKTGSKKLNEGEIKLAEANRATDKHGNRMSILEERMAAIEERKSILNEHMKNLEDGKAGVRDAMENILHEWEGNSSKEAKAAMKAREKAMEGRSPELGRLESADSSVDNAVNSIAKKDYDLNRQDLDSRADETIDRILGSPNGRLDYENSSKSDGFSQRPEARGSARGRKFAMPYEMKKDFLVRDVNHVMASHVRTQLPDILLNERFGDVELKDQFRDINEHYAQAINEAKTPSQALSLRKQQEADIRDVSAILSRVRNTYGFSSDPTTRQVAAISRDLRGILSINSLGTSALNRLNDWGGIATLRYGFEHVFQDQFRPLLKSLVGQSEFYGVSRAMAKEAQIGIDGKLGDLMHNMHDAIDFDAPNGKLSKGIQVANNASLHLNGHTWATDAAKSVGFITAQSKFSKTIAKIVDGSARDADYALMANAGVPSKFYQALHEQFQAHSIVVDGVRIADTANWTNAAARDVLEAALSKEVNGLVLTAGHGTKPLFMSKPIGAMLGQFKGFVAAANEKVLISGLQQADRSTIEGVLTATAMGMLSYRLYTLASGQEFNSDPRHLIHEGIHRSGMLGWFGETNQVLSKLSGGSVDVHRLYGATEPLTRRVNTTVTDELAGPVIGGVSKVLMAGAHALAGTYNHQDTHALRTTLMPLQNLMGFRILLDKVEAGTNNIMGVENKKPKSMMH